MTKSKKPEPSKKQKPQEVLVFIDANIFLDFYRQPSVAAKSLARLPKHTDNLILTHQVHQEFLKHRQKVIHAALHQIKLATISGVPLAFSEMDAAKELVSHSQKAKQQYERLLKAAQEMMTYPEHDQVFEAVKGLHATNSVLNLTSGSAQDEAVARRAEARRLVGKPPGKDGQSIGDAINWEWILECAKNRTDANVLIVSRDSDYGLFWNSQWHVNDYLVHEFRERVGQGARIALTDSLVQALEQLHEPISESESEAEKPLLYEDRYRAIRNYLTHSLANDDRSAMRARALLVPSLDFLVRSAIGTDPVQEIIHEILHRNPDIVNDLREALTARLAAKRPTSGTKSTKGDEPNQD